MRVLGIIAMSWLVWAAAAAAQEPEQGIIVTGEGRISMAPDMAQISLGVQKTAATAKEAMDNVSQEVAVIIDRLDALGVAARDRQTDGFFLHPVQNNRSVSSDQPPQIVGYRAGNTVKVRVRDLAKLGAMLDGVIETGANDFNGLSFGLKNPAPAKARARAAAVADAMERAGELADAAGLALGTVLRMTEHSNVSRPAPMMEMSAARGSMGDAIATGEVDVTAQVTMVFAIAPGLP